MRPDFDAVALAGLDLLLAQMTDEEPVPGRVVIAPDSGHTGQRRPAGLTDV